MMTTNAPTHLHQYHYPVFQRLLIIIALLVAFAAWGVMLAGVASLQQSCKYNLNLQGNSLAATQAEIATLGGSTTVNPAELAAILSNLAKRSTNVFTLTPDTRCKDFYRYPWLAMSMEFVVLLLAFMTAPTAALYRARVAICSLAAVATVLAIENAQTFYYERQWATGGTVARGKVFFAGCIGVAGANIILMFLLGIARDHTYMNYATGTIPNGAVDYDPISGKPRTAVVNNTHIHNAPVGATIV